MGEDLFALAKRGEGEKAEGVVKWIRN